MKNIFWNGYTGSERNATLSAIQSIVIKHGAIIDFRKYSDLSITLVLEVEESKLKALHQALTDCIRLEKYELPESGSDKERTVFLNVTFTSGTGDLKVHVPPVPG